MTMTNKELAEKAEGVAARLRMASVTGHSAYGLDHFLDDLADWLRSASTPDPDPEPAKDLRWLVGRHECLSRELKLESEQMGDKWPWRWLDSFITESAALTVVRGIVKSKCDEHGGVWSPTGLDVCLRPSNRWYYHWSGENHYHPTELEAIDALLTAMKGAA